MYDSDLAPRVRTCYSRVARVVCAPRDAPTTTARRDARQHRDTRDEFRMCANANVPIFVGAVFSEQSLQPLCPHAALTTSADNCQFAHNSAHSSHYRLAEQRRDSPHTRRTFPPPVATRGSIAMLPLPGVSVSMGLYALTDHHQWHSRALFRMRGFNLS